MPKQKIVFASGNAGKLREIQHCCCDLALDIQPQSEFNITSVAETGLTFVENALLKARHAAENASLPALADDSGLVIDALNGEPGIYSARYAGVNASDQDNINKLLNDLQAFPEPARQAYFFCVLVLLQHPRDPCPIICQGRWHGQILTQPSGNQGFGYDPIFYVPSEDCSAAELPLARKNQISHRGQALAALCQHFAAGKLTQN